MFMCIFVWIYDVVEGSHRGQKVSDTLELQLQRSASLHPLCGSWKPSSILFKSSKLLATKPSL